MNNQNAPPPSPRQCAIIAVRICVFFLCCVFGLCCCCFGASIPASGLRFFCFGSGALWFSLFCLIRGRVLLVLFLSCLLCSGCFGLSSLIFFGVLLFFFSVAAHLQGFFVRLYHFCVVCSFGCVCLFL